jgi:RimJ/RimL family protein N-acetyltransferase
MDRASALSQLPAVYARALLMRDEGMDDDRVAHSLDIPAESIPALFRIAEAKLLEISEPLSRCRGFEADVKSPGPAAGDGPVPKGLYLLATLLQAATLAHVEALIAGDEVFAAEFGLRVIPGYLAFPEALEFTRKGLAEGLDPNWSSHLIIDPGAGELVGLGGFKGPPVHGEVEIGYGVAPERQGRGIATAAACWLTETAFARGVQVVVAHTLAELNASTTVLQRCGMTKVGELVDPGDGPIWRWEVRRA